MLIDTHSHIHFDTFRLDIDDILDRAHLAGVDKMLVVGVSDTDTSQAIAVARSYQNLWATAGLHPHDADRGYEALEEIATLATHESVVAIGECGLDYYKSETSPEDQERVLRFQIELAIELKLPMIFHIRNAFPEFWHIFDDYTREGEKIRGVVHSFTAGVAELEGSLDRGLNIALNGIMTFTEDRTQLNAAKRVPLDRLILETDCPFLAPVPMRGKRNEPAYIAHTAKFLAGLRDENPSELENATSKNAEALFGI